MKLATETITVFHYAYDPKSGYDDWTPTVISGVSLHGDTATTVTDTGLAAASKYVIRIPTTDEISVKAGDIIVKGLTEAKNPNDVDEGDKITVVGVTDNRRGRAPHWKIVGN